MTFKHLSTFTSALSLALFAVLLFSPATLMMLMELEAPPEAAFLARRAAMIFLGISVMSWLARDQPPSPMRRAYRIGVSTLMFALAALGVAEFARGFAGAGIFIAITTEILLAGLMLRSSDDRRGVVSS